MASSRSASWSHQAYSDFQAARRVYLPDEPGSYCQTIAKCQQCVEKSVKAVVDLLGEIGLLRAQIRFNHDIRALLTSLEYIPVRSQYRDLILDFVGAIGPEGDRLMALAPRRPADLNAPLPRNTEYPYQNPDGTWRSPAEPGSFDAREAEHWLAFAQRVRHEAIRLRETIARVPPRKP